MPRFTLRDLFWLILVVAMGVGWWVDRSRVAEQFDAARSLLKQNGITLNRRQSP